MTNTLPESKNSHRKKPVVYSRPLKLWNDVSHQQGEVQVNIIPLIDVIFCILTFFILGAVGLSRQQALNLDLPKASSGTPQMREMMVVSLDDIGRLYVEKQSVSKEQLQEAIKNYHQYNPRGLMILNASRNARYDEVIQVLDMLKKVGGDRVALATLPGDAQTNLDSSSYSNYNALPQTPNNSRQYNPQLPANSTPNSFESQGNFGNSSVPSVPNAPRNNSQTAQ